jgi:integral membrane protein (TIGR01906 family)
VNYLRGRATLDDMAELRTDAGEIALRPSEVQHMVDVKQVIDGFFVAHVAGSVLALGSSTVLLRRRPVGWARSLRHGIWATFGLIAIVAVAAAIDFDLFFTYFHRVFFEEGTWLFFYEDTLIQLYPLTFWIRAVAEISMAIVAGGAVLYTLSRWVEERALRREVP